MKAGQSTDDAARGVVRSVRMSHRILTCSTSTSARWVLSEICPHGVVTRGSSVTVSACDQDPIVVTWRGLSEPVVPEPVLPVTASNDEYDRPPTEGAIDDISREPDQP